MRKPHAGYKKNEDLAINRQGSLDVRTLDLIRRQNKLCIEEKELLTLIIFKLNLNILF